MIPLMHDFEGETVLVVGGGSVGARKARTFATEASVVVLSPEFGDRTFADAEKSEPHRPRGRHRLGRADRPGAGRCRDRRLGPERAFSTAAAEHGALVNRTDDLATSVRHHCRACHGRDDPVTLAIATGGRAPALSKHLASGSKTSSETLA